MTERIYHRHNNIDELVAWLDAHIGPARGKIAGHGWIIANDFNFRARRITKFWVEFEDWVTDEQKLAFRLTWSA